MKKVFTLLLSLALIATLSVASFAATATSVPSSEGKDLNVGYTAQTAASTVYSVDILWEDDLAFDYSAGTQGAWDPTQHDYAATSGAGWPDDTVAVTVTNHSNADVVVNLSVTDTNAEDGVTVTPATASDTLTSGVNLAYEAADAVTFTLKATGTPTAAITKVATATVSFAAAD